MALIDELTKKNIHPMFWPPLDDKGNAASKWQGRARSCKNSFATFLSRSGKSKDGRAALKRGHVAKADR